ncbi:hypothetical protein [uncultured Neptuniibacter sp.]|uniref:hypothetical protein n=1 Tax=uncultured Neptuniibacter sp. TaxID=502143 RepID=UPI0026339698|nr:hypothetical protein [uncultured Neptuniibacter sp.]
MTTYTAPISKEEATLAIKAAGPFTYFITLPFLKPKGRSCLSLNEGIDQFNALCHLMNQKLYGRKYMKQGHFMQGYACIEDHAVAGEHFHALIKRDEAQFMKDYPNFREIFYQSASKLRRYNPIKQTHCYNLTQPDHLDVQYLPKHLLVNQPGYYPNRYDDLATYLIKQRKKPLYLRRNRICRIYPLSVNGIDICDYGTGGL